MQLLKAVYSSVLKLRYEEKKAQRTDLTRSRSVAQPHIARLTLEGLDKRGLD